MHSEHAARAFPLSRPPDGSRAGSSATAPVHDANVKAAARTCTTSPQCTPSSSFWNASSSPSASHSATPSALRASASVSACAARCKRRTHRLVPPSKRIRAHERAAACWELATPLLCKRFGARGRIATVRSVPCRPVASYLRARTWPPYSRRAPEPSAGREAR